MNPVEIFAVLFGLIYVYYSIRNSATGFYFALASCSLWAYADIIYYNYKFDAILQGFYVVMALWGLQSWNRKDKPTLEITHLGIKDNILAIILGILGMIISVYLIRMFTDSDYIWLDSFTTVFSILATFMLIYRKIDNWIYFFICNLIYIYLYYVKQAPFFTLLMIIYSVLSIVGFMQWMKLSRDKWSESAVNI
ncbi:MAG TPA: nicotinamide riboside transporter PnuC [Saprospiraceae bacterium]|nr:nicotinamide mononucleotide transporter [Saprospiraceae bacterium]MCB9328741.1 nicotinamide mononucleotide transporter [Lewinellaceae bacterium]HPK09090.1 nicotinamide riboside transporter PnuC [Saprospiraceae bacterium]HPQ21501.1 nicotinamide riboside transporter PnuC [Saprospiraceae bacterium]